MSPSDRLARLTRQLRGALAGLFDQSQPFGRLAVVHSVFTSATTLVTISLAGSLFFSVNPHESKSRVLLYLLLTLAPFAVVAPALSPLLDRGVMARRASVAVASIGSAIFTVLMARDLKGLLLFPEAFGILVLSKLYLVAKAALVPSMTESEDDLASANAKLAVLAALSGFVVSPIGIGLLQLGAAWVLRLAFLVFIGGAVAAIRLPKSHSVPAPVGSSAEEQGDGSRRSASAEHPWSYPSSGSELPSVEQPQQDSQPQPTEPPPGAILYSNRHGRTRLPRTDVKAERARIGLQLIVPEVTIALAAVTVLRGSFGFLSFFLAFDLRSIHAATWWYGFILLASGVGGLAGSMSVPYVRRHLSEQQLIFAALALTALFGVFVALSGSIWVQPILALVVGNTSTGAKPAFDSIAQRYVPPAALGRAFARFETQLQLVWVLAALVAVLVSSRLPFRAGDLIIAIASAVAAAFHLSMRHSWRRRDGTSGSAGARAADKSGSASESSPRRTLRLGQGPDGRRPGQGASAGG